MKTLIALLLTLTASIAYAKASEDTGVVQAPSVSQKSADIKTLLKKAIVKLIPMDGAPQIYKPQEEYAPSGLMMDLIKGPEYRETQRLSELSKDEMARMRLKEVFGPSALIDKEDGTDQLNGVDADQ